jgi:hypothetical protein
VFSIEIRSIVSIARRACFILVKGLKYLPCVVPILRRKGDFRVFRCSKNLREICVIRSINFRVFRVFRCSKNLREICFHFVYEKRVDYSYSSRTNCSLILSVIGNIAEYFL